jgi:hypothetical protein
MMVMASEKNLTESTSEPNPKSLAPEDGWRKISISYNVGGVKQYPGALLHALVEERHFALVDGLRFPTLGSFLIVGVRTQFDPAISSIPNCDHDYLFELPWFWERDTHSIARCFIAHHSDFRAVPRADRTFSTARNPIQLFGFLTSRR